MDKKTYFARDERGKLLKKSFKSEGDGERWKSDMQKRRHAFRDGRRVPFLDSITLGEYAHYWLKQLVQDNPISTVDDYGRKLSLHVLRYLKDKAMKELGQADYEILLNHIQVHHGLSNATRNRVRSVLSSLYTDAVKDQVVPVNPISPIEVKKENPRAKHVLISEDQCRAYLNGARAWRWDFYVFLHLLLNLGTRKGENIAIPWKNYDRERRVIKISQIFEQKTGKIVERTKSDGLKKVVKVKYAGVSDTLKQVLDEHFLKTPYNKPDDCIVTMPNGSPMKPRRATTLHTQLLAKLGLPHCRIHDLRHAVGTMLYRQLGDLKAVQEQLGHSDIKTTQMYVHLDADDAAKRMKKYKLFKHKTDKKTRSNDTFYDTGVINDTRNEKSLKC